MADALPGGVRLRPATRGDAAEVAAIYARYVRESSVTFELEPPAPQEMSARIGADAGLYPWIVAEAPDGSLAGYAYACPFRPRAAYRFTVETSVYLRPEATGRGVGAAVYRPLLVTLEAQGFTQAIAAVALPNPASVTLHERLGFAHAGTYREVGYKLGRWVDVGLWQRPLAQAGATPAEPLHLEALEGWPI